jgi:hypothetical protein
MGLLLIQVRECTDQGQERKGIAWNAKEGAAHGPSAAQRCVIRAKGKRTEAGVAGKSYSLERKVSSTRWRVKGEPKENNESESGRCSRGVRTIRQRRKKGSMRKPYHEGKRHTASARVPRHGRSLACTTVYIHIGLLTSKGLAQREEWRR